MKLLKIFVLIFALFLLYCFFTAFPAVQESNRCIAGANIKMGKLKRMVVELQWDKEQVCTEGGYLVDEINTCLTNAKKDNQIGSMVIELAGGAFPQLREGFFTKTHNEGCAEFSDLFR